MSLRSSRWRRYLHLTVLACLVAQSAVAQAQPRFTESLWTENADVYAAILRHPFLTELTRGTLKREAFAFYMMQDVSYLRAFGRALDVIAAKAPRPEWRDLLARHARESLAAELQLHDSVFKDYGITPAQVARLEPAPEGFAYETFMIAAAHTQSFEESLSALLPCYWVYLEVGKQLKKTGSRDKTYQRWIDNYSSPDYQQTVEAVLAIIDSAAASASEDTRATMRRNFRRAFRYEWMFWDSAYSQRRWPPLTGRR